MTLPALVVPGADFERRRDRYRYRMGNVADPLEFQNRAPLAFELAVIESARKRFRERREKLWAVAPRVLMYALKGGRQDSLDSLEGPRKVISRPIW